MAGSALREREPGQNPVQGADGISRRESFVPIVGGFAAAGVLGYEIFRQATDTAINAASGGALEGAREAFLGSNTSLLSSYRLSHLGVQSIRTFEEEQDGVKTGRFGLQVDTVRNDLIPDQPRNHAARITINNLSQREAALSAIILGGSLSQDQEQFSLQMEDLLKAFGGLRFLGIVTPHISRRTLLALTATLGGGVALFGFAGTVNLLTKGKFFEQFGQLTQDIFTKLGEIGRGIGPDFSAVPTVDAHFTPGPQPSAVLSPAKDASTAVPTSTDTPPSVSVPTRTDTPTVTITITTVPPTETPTATPTPKPLENLGPPSASYESPVNKTATSQAGWAKDSYYSIHEVGGNIEVVNKIDYPDSQSKYAPQTNQILKNSVADVDKKADTSVYMSVEGPPMSVPLRARVSVQVSKEFNQVLDSSGYNGLFTLFNDTKDPGQGRYWSQWATIGLRANGTLNFSSFFADGANAFTIRRDNYRLTPDKWHELEIRIDANGYANVYANEILIADGQLPKLPKDAQYGGSARLDEGLSVLNGHAGAHTKGIKGGASVYVLNGPLFFESWKK